MTVVHYNIHPQGYDVTTRNYDAGPIDVTGCVTSAMVMRGDLPSDAVPNVIERDRQHMAARPGFHLKLLPVLQAPDTGHVLTGGAYLFDSGEQAQAFADWTVQDFIIDGVPFVEMPALLSRTAKVWQIAGAENLAAVEAHQIVMRVEEWQMPTGMMGRDLVQDWENIRDAARHQGLTAVWLLYDDARSEFGVVTSAARRGSAATDEPDLASLQNLSASESLGARYQASGAAKIFDRSSFVFCVWFPITGDNTDLPPLWPNSPPLPGPTDS